MAATLEGRRVAESVEEWLKGQSKPPLPPPVESELRKIQKALDAMEACPPLWWADKLLWKGLRWFYRMRRRRVKEAFDGPTRDE